MDILETQVVTSISTAIDPIWAEFQSTLQLVIKGLIIGIVVSAPMGPTGILCIQRTINKGRDYGLATGAGAALSDFIYAVITGLGMSYVLEYIERPEIIFVLKVLGSVLLLCFGIITYRSDSSKRLRKPSGNKGTLIGNFFSAFFITFANPLIIFLFVALYAQFTFVVPDNVIGLSMGYLSIIAGAMLWWGGLTYILSRMKSSIGSRGLVIMNRTIGCIVIFASLIYAAVTLFKINVKFF